MSSASSVVLAGILLAIGLRAVASEALPLERVVEGQTILSTSDPAIRIQIAQGYEYVGGQRFILRGVADAEQHFFVDADEAKAIQRLYWIQFEHFLPAHDGEYSYERDEPLTLGDLGLRVHVRRYTEPPAADSDRARAFEYLERAGYAVPTTGTRVRLVYVPDADRRQEVMIIYLERSTATVEPTGQEAASIVERARAGMALVP